MIPAVSGIYSVTMVATNSAGSGQLTQNISVTVQPGPIADATPDQTVLSLPNAIILFTNNSQNADTYFWDFGDGESTVDSDPWHQYSSAGAYSVMLIAQRDGCLSDTAYFMIEVGQAAIEDQTIELLRIYPNPTKGSIAIKGEGLTEIQLFEINGKEVLSSQFNDESLIELDLSALAKGTYLLKVKSNGIHWERRVVKID